MPEYTAEEMCELRDILPGWNPVEDGMAGPMSVLNALFENAEEGGDFMAFFECSTDEDEEFRDPADTRFSKLFREAFCCEADMLSVLIVPPKEETNHFDDVIVPLIEWRLKRGR